MIGMEIQICSTAAKDDVFCGARECGGMPVENIDEARVNDPECVTEYVNGIYDYLRSREARLSIGYYHFLICDYPLFSCVQKNLISFLSTVQVKYSIPNDYMSKQVDVNEKMRTILIDWLLEVHLKFKLLPETLFLSVSIIDRFLTLKCVAREQLQLVGVTAMFIACKYEEIYPPEVRCAEMVVPYICYTFKIS